MKALTKILLGILLVILALCLSVWLIRIGWGMFAVPIFELKELSISEAIGLLILMSGFTGFRYKKS